MRDIWVVYYAKKEDAYEIHICAMFEDESSAKELCDDYNSGFNNREFDYKPMKLFKTIKDYDIEQLKKKIPEYKKYIAEVNANKKELKIIIKGRYRGEFTLKQYDEILSGDGYKKYKLFDLHEAKYRDIEEADLPEIRKNFKRTFEDFQKLPEKLKEMEKEYIKLSGKRIKKTKDLELTK